MKTENWMGNQNFVLLRFRSLHLEIYSKDMFRDSSCTHQPVFLHLSPHPRSYQCGKGKLLEFPTSCPSDSTSVEKLEGLPSISSDPLDDHLRQLQQHGGNLVDRSGHETYPEDSGRWFLNKWARPCSDLWPLTLMEPIRHWAENGFGSIRSILFIWFSETSLNRWQRNQKDQKTTMQRETELIQREIVMSSWSHKKKNGSEREKVLSVSKLGQESSNPTLWCLLEDVFQTILPSSPSPEDAAAGGIRAWDCDGGAAESAQKRSWNQMFTSYTEELPNVAWKSFIQINRKKIIQKPKSILRKPRIIRKPKKPDSETKDYLETKRSSSEAKKVFFGNQKV